MIKEVNDRIMNVCINPQVKDYESGKVKRYRIEVEVREDVFDEVLKFILKYRKMKMVKINYLTYTIILVNLYASFIYILGRLIMGYFVYPIIFFSIINVAILLSIVLVKIDEFLRSKIEIED